MIEIINLDESEALRIKKESSRTHFETKIGFLKEHNGLRPNKLHVILGVTSGGKSTLRNTIMLDFLKHNFGKKILLWLSEESKQDLLADLSRNMALSEHFNGKLMVTSELDSKIALEGQLEAISHFSETLIQAQCDLLIFDNITTSRVYGSSFAQNEHFCNELRRFMEIVKCPFLVFAHTGSQVKEGEKRLLQNNDIRGSKTFTNIAHFFYILQGFRMNGTPTTTLRMTKHRGTNISNRMFILPYDSKTMTYKGSMEVPFEKFKRLYQEQDSLSGRE